MKLKNETALAAALMEAMKATGAKPQTVVRRQHWQRFDLLAYITDMQSPGIAYDVMSSTAWRMDSLIVSTSRQLLNVVKNRMIESGEVANATEANAILAQPGVLTDVAGAHTELGKWFEDAGKLVAHPTTLLCTLNVLRDEVHEQASNLAGMALGYDNMPRMHLVPDIEDIFVDEREPKVSPQAQARAVQTAAALARGNAEKAAQLLARSLERKQRQAEDLAERAAVTAPLARDLFIAVCRAGVGDGSDSPTPDMWSTYRGEGAKIAARGFPGLPATTRQVLVQNAFSAATRALDWAENRSSVSDYEYQQMLSIVDNFEQDMPAILAALRTEAQESVV